MTGTIVQDNGSTPSQRRSLSLADVVIEADPKEIEAKRSKLEWVYQPLVADTAAKEVQLDAITKMVNMVVRDFILMWGWSEMYSSWPSFLAEPIEWGRKWGPKWVFFTVWEWAHTGFSEFDLPPKPKI